MKVVELFGVEANILKVVSLRSGSEHNGVKEFESVESR